MSNVDKAERKKENWRRYYYKNQEHFKARAVARNQAMTEYVNTYKTHLGCLYCPERFGPALDLHHRDPSQKVAEVSQLKSIKKIDEELLKCDVVCKNCHAKLHHGVVLEKWRN